MPTFSASLEFISLFQVNLHLFFLYYTTKRLYSQDNCPLTSNIKHTFPPVFSIKTSIKSINITIKTGIASYKTFIVTTNALHIFFQVFINIKIFIHVVKTILITILRFMYYLTVQNRSQFHSYLLEQFQLSKNNIQILLNGATTF